MRCGREKYIFNLPLMQKSEQSEIFTENINLGIINQNY